MAETFAAPVFLVGFARSGTTWLAQALRDHLGVGMANEGTFITDLGRGHAADAPVADPKRLIEQIEAHEFSRILLRAYDIRVDWPRIVAERRGGRYADFVGAGLADIARQMDCPRPGSKSPAFGRRPEVLLRHFPHSRIVHLIRDGRDCALSHYQMDWGRRNAYVVARLWRRYIHRTRAAVTDTPAAYLEVRYEDLLGDPRTHFRRVAEFVAAGGNAAAAATDDAVAGFAAGVGAEAFDKRAYKWKQDMTPADIRIFDATAGTTLVALGYPARAGDRPLPRWRRAYYYLDDRIKREYNHRQKQRRRKTPSRGKA